MSLRLKSELLIRLGVDTCSADVMPAGWQASPVAKSLAQGSDEVAMTRAIDQLEAIQGQLPNSARLICADEWVYMEALPAVGPYRSAKLRARAHFTEVLGPGDWGVEVTLAPSGAHWLCFALDGACLERWRDVLIERGIRLRSVQPAALLDLACVQTHLTEAPQVLALMGSEGLTLASYMAGRLDSLEWVRCDLDNPDSVGVAVHSSSVFSGHDPNQADSEGGRRVTLIARRRADQLRGEALMDRHGWQMPHSGLVLQEAA